MIGSKHPKPVNRALMEVLIQATEQVLIERGANGVTMIRIASKAGLTIDAIMESLPSKDVIVAEAMERLRKRGVAIPSGSPVAAAVARPRAPAAAAAPAPPARRAPPPAAAPVRSGVAAPPAAPARSGAAAPAATPTRSGVVTPAAARGRSKPVPAAAPARARSKPVPAAASARARSKSVPAAAPPLRPPAPDTSRETLEGGITAVVHQLVSALAGHLPARASMPQGERDKLHRVELDRMAKASTAMLKRHKVPDPSHVAHVMTLSCDRVIKDVMRNAPESFADGRLEQALCRLCLDFVRSG